MEELYEGMILKENSDLINRYFNISIINKNKNYVIITWLESNIEFEEKISLKWVEKLLHEKVWVHCIKEERKRKIKEIRDL